MADNAAVFFEDCRERYNMHVTDPPSPDDVADVDCGQAPSPRPAVTKVFEMAARRRDLVHNTSGSPRPAGQQLYLHGCGEVMGEFPTDDAIVAMPD